MRACLVIGLIVAYAWLGHSYVAVWQSDLTLWNHARLQSPWKPRPTLNYAKALSGEGRDDESLEMMARASALEQKRQWR